MKDGAIYDVFRFNLVADSRRYDKSTIFYTINQQIVLIEQKANFFLVKTIVAATAFHNLAKYAAVYDHLIHEI